MRKSIVFIGFSIFFVLFALNTAFAQRGTARADVINIRLASPLPRNSDWGRSLDRLAAEWERVTDGSVRVIISHDGREGTEMMMLSSLASNSNQVAIFTSAGMAEICPAVMNLSIPFVIRNEAELDLVLADVLPLLESRVRSDFVVLAWSKSGWIYLFTKEPVHTPEELRRQRLATSPDLKDMNTVFRNMGFNLVEMDWVNIGTRLANNTVNAIYVIPAIVAPMQLHRTGLNHMLNVPIAPVIGAMVINRVTWDRITAAHQQEILRVTRRLIADFDVSMARAEATAISAMGRDGLSVNRLTPAQDEMWRSELEHSIPTLIGPIFDREIYHRINVLLERARNAR